MSFLQTAFQTTRGARSANSELAWFQRVSVGGRVAVRDSFKCTRGTVSVARRRTRDMQETPRKGSDTKERILDVAEAAVLRRASPQPRSKR